MVDKGTRLVGSDPALRIVGAERRTRAVRLRLSGLRWDQVAEQAGYSTGNDACEAVRLALKESLGDLAEAAHEYRAVELGRLEAIIAAHWSEAVSGENLKAAELVLKTIDRIARLTGTAQPVQVDVTGGVTYEVVGWTPPGAGSIPGTVVRRELEE